ncbi:MAG TPA: hypothetical protein PKX18_10155, partial [Thermosynergistes sp.]|nr:hypothetical protein [Thermosynergistes sp.]
IWFVKCQEHNLSHCFDFVNGRARKDKRALGFAKAKKKYAMNAGMHKTHATHDPVVLHEFSAFICIFREGI